MSAHRMALAHAQETVATLLEAVLDASKPLKLAKLEGDAAFLYAPVKNEQNALGHVVADIRRSFLAKQQDIAFNRLCSCHGCVEAGTLTLKFVVHVGEVAFQKVKRYTELAGMDVILVHRMLKNDVPAREYVLMTEGALEKMGANISKLARPIAHDFEGIGQTATHFIDLADVSIELPPPVKKSLARRWWDRIVMNVKVLHYFFGFKEPCVNFHNMQIDPIATQK